MPTWTDTIMERECHSFNFLPDIRNSNADVLLFFLPASCVQEPLVTDSEAEDVKQ